MARQPTRLKDIAAVTGVTANTVSLALRGNTRIPEETRKRILAAARKLNYLPNQVAQSLVSRETRTVGLILTSIVNPILTHAARAIERELAARGYSLMLSATENDVGKETEALDVFRSRQVDGMLIYAASHSVLDHIRPLRRAGYPIVLLVDDPTRRLDVVSVDDRRGAEIATDHLAALGHRRIAFLDAGSPLGNFEKVDGYRKGLAKAGIAFNPRLVLDPHGHSAAEGYAAFTAFLARRGARPTALLASNDLALVGFDDIEASDYAPVPLTTVHYGADELSKAAVDRLLELINAPDRLPRPTQIFIEPTLVVRESCGAKGDDRRRGARVRGAQAVPIMGAA
jgi:LacI family transcriptional regulator